LGKKLRRDFPTTEQGKLFIYRVYLKIFGEEIKERFPHNRTR